jgi:hypothetical protein
VRVEDFERLYIEGEFYGYFKKHKLSNNQTIAIFFMKEIEMGITEFHVLLAIANKRKYIKQWLMGERDVFGEKTTGTCGLEGLLWAKRQLIAFENFIKTRYKHVIIVVNWLDNRRRKVYEYGLGKIGYRMGYRHSQKCLFKKIA